MASNNSQQLTPASEWRKPREEGYEITLLSGRTAKLRPVALDVLISSGGLPDVLTPFAAQTLWQEREPDEIADAAEMAKSYSELINAIVPAAFLYPKVVENPEEDDEIGLDDIDFADKIQVFNLATAGAMALRKFRDQQGGNVEAGPDREGDGDKAEQAATD